VPHCHRHAAQALDQSGAGEIWGGWKAYCRGGINGCRGIEGVTRKNHRGCDSTDVRRWLFVGLTTFLAPDRKGTDTRRSPAHDRRAVTACPSRRREHRAARWYTGWGMGRVSTQG